MGLKEMVFGSKPNSSGYYQEFKQFYQVPGDQIIHKPGYTSRAGVGECERVTPLTARNWKQWIGSTAGVLTAGVAAFVFIALVKKDEKFDTEVVQKLKKLISL